MNFSEVLVLMSAAAGLDVDVSRTSSGSPPGRSLDLHTSVQTAVQTSVQTSVQTLTDPVLPLLPARVMTSSYAHVMDRQPVPNRLESPITSNLDTLQAKKNFSVSHLLDLEEAGEMVAGQAEEGVGEAGRSMLESPGLTSGSDTTQQESKCPAAHGRAAAHAPAGKCHAHFKFFLFFFRDTLTHLFSPQSCACPRKESVSESPTSPQPPPKRLLIFI